MPTRPQSSRVVPYTFGISSPPFQWTGLTLVMGLVFATLRIQECAWLVSGLTDTGEEQIAAALEATSPRVHTAGALHFSRRVQS